MARYELKQGKYGMYFYDNEYKRDMTLEKVVNSLNRKEELKEKILFMRQLFKDAVKAHTSDTRKRMKEYAEGNE